MALPSYNLERIKTLTRELLICLGEDPEREGLRETPTRVANLYSDILDMHFSATPIMKSFEKDIPYTGLVMVHHFPFYGFCEHHLLPFIGHAGIAYVPHRKKAGLSKLVRIFRHYCKKITVQERLTQEVLDAVTHQILPKGAMVYVQAEHMCMSLRGVKSPGAITTTTAYNGVFDTDSELRQQFLEEASK